MNREKNFSFLRGETLVVSVDIGQAEKFPLTYTLEEALEDWCDNLGFGFVEILDTLPDRNVGGLGSGKFSYKLITTHGSFNVHSRLHSVRWELV